MQQRSRRIKNTLNCQVVWRCCMECWACTTLSKLVVEHRLKQWLTEVGLPKSKRSKVMIERDPRHSKKDKATGFGWSKMKPNQWVWPQVSEEDWCAELFLKRPLRGRPEMAAHSLLMNTATLSSRWSSRVIRSRLLELFNLDRIIFTAWMILNLHVVVNNYIRIFRGNRLFLFTSNLSL